MLAMQRPTDVSGLRRFLGLAGCFREFIKDYAKITLNIIEALKAKE